MFKKLSIFLLLFSGMFHLLYCQETTKERIIYVPISEWEKVLKQEPKGVRIPYKEYLELLKKQPKKEIHTPETIIINGVKYEAVIENKVLHIDMTMELSSLTDKLQSFKFVLGKMGVEKAFINNVAATLQVRKVFAKKHLIDNIPNQMLQNNSNANNDKFFAPKSTKFEYKFFIKGKGQHTLKLKLRKSLSLNRDELFGNIELGHFPKQLFSLKTNKNMEYNTNVASQRENNGKLQVFLDKRSRFHLNVRPKEQKDQKKPLLIAHNYGSHLIGDASLSSLFRIELEVFHSPQKTFQILLPHGIEIISISENRWETKELKEHQLLIIQLEKEITGKHTILLKSEKQLPGDIRFQLPKLKMIGSNVFRQDGVAYIEHTSDIRLETYTLKRVRQLNPQTLFLRRKGKAFRGIFKKHFHQNSFAAFKFWNTTYDIQLRKKMITPKLESTSVTAVSIYEDGLETSTMITFDLLEGKVKQLHAKLPKGWMLSSLSAQRSSAHSYYFRKISIPNYYVKDGILYISLQSKLTKGEKFKLSLKLQSMPDKWQTRWNTQKISLPLVRPLYSKFLPSFLGVIADPDYKLELLNRKYIDSVDLGIIKSLQITSNNLRLGLRVSNLKAKAFIKLTRKTPQVTVVTSNYIAIETERIRCAKVLVFQIKNASRDYFHFRFPKRFKNILNISDEFGFIKERVEKQTEDGRDWIIKLHKKVLGAYTLYLTYEVPIKGKTPRFDFPVITFPEIKKVRGYLGISGTSQAEITVTSSGLTSILNSQFPRLAHPDFSTNANYLHTFKYSHSKFSLSLNIKLHGKINVASAILNSVKITTLYPQNDLERVTCEYSLSHLGMQFFNIHLPKNANFWSVLVDGKGEKPLKRSNFISIPVPRHNNGKSNTIKVVYERNVPKLKSFGSIKLLCPITDKKIPIKKLYWYLYLPKGYKLTGENKRRSFKPWYKIFSFRFSGGVQEKSKISYNERNYKRDMPTQKRYYPPKKVPQHFAKQKKYSKIRILRPKNKINTRRYQKRKRRYKIGKKLEKKYEPRKEPVLEEEKSEAPKEDAFDDGLLSDKTKSIQKPQEIEDIDEDDEEGEYSKPDDIDPSSGKNSSSDKFHSDWSKNETDGEKERKSQIFDTKKPFKGQSFSRKDKTGVFSVKARGLRSIAINLDTAHASYHTLGVSPLTNTINVSYSYTDTSRSIQIILLGASALIGLFVLLTHKLSKVTTFFTAILVLSFIPAWFGNWTMPYCNALVGGLFLSLFLAVLYKIFTKLETWMTGKTAVLIFCIFLFSNQSFTQEKVRNIYVPYETKNVKELKKLKDVFIPYDTYIDLWNKAYPHKSVSKNERNTKLPFCIYHANYEGKIENKQAIFQAQFFLEVNKAPAIVPLGLSGTAVETATLQKENGRPINLNLQPTHSGYSVIIEENGRYKIRLQFFAQGNINPKRGNLGLKLEPVPTSVLRFIMDSDLKPNIENFKGDWYEKNNGKKKIVVLYPGLEKKIDINWFQSSEQYRARGINITVTSKHGLTVEDNLLRLDSSIHYQIISGKKDKLTLSIPQKYKIIQLHCTNLERWILSKEKGRSKIILRLANPLQRKISVHLKLEKTLKSLDQSEQFPEIIPLDASRENGILVLSAHNSYNVITERSTSLRKIGIRQHKDYFLELYRFSEHPFTLDFKIKPQKLHNFSSSFISMKINEENVIVEHRNTLEIKGKEIFDYVIHFPSYLEAKIVTGYVVKNWRVEKKDKGKILHILFNRNIKKGEKIQLYIKFETPLKKDITIPTIYSPFVHYQYGSILISSFQDLNINISEISGLEEYDVAAFQSTSGYVKRYAYKFEDGQYSGKAKVQSQKAEKSVDTVINLLVEDDWINFGYFLNYAIKFAATDNFSFRLPLAIGKNIEIFGENIKEKSLNIQGKYCFWTVTLHNKVRNKYSLAIFPPSFENEGIGIKFYRIAYPREVRQRLNILIQDKSQYELIPQVVKGLTLVSPSKAIFFPPKTHSGNFMMAYKMDRLDWELKFSENKQKLVYSAKANIETMKVDTKIDKTGRCRTRIVYNLRHWGLQFLEVERLQNVNIWGVFVAGKFIKPVKRMEDDGKEQVLIPLQANASSKSVEKQLSVRIIYSQKFHPISSLGRIELELPLITNVKEVGEVKWTVNLPSGYIYKFDGNISRKAYLSFQEFTSNYNRYTQTQSVMKGNKLVLQSAFSLDNDLKIRQKKWIKSKETNQQRIFNEIQQQENYNDNIDRVQQYGKRNLMEIRRVGRSNNRGRFYIDKQGSRFAGEKTGDFVKRQTLNFKNQITTKSSKKQETPNFYFDLDSYNYSGLTYHFSKKQGNAKLRIRCYLVPKKNKFWISLQFIILGLMILVVHKFKLLSFKDGYSFNKVGLTGVVILITILSFNFLSFVHYFYL